MEEFKENTKEKNVPTHVSIIMDGNGRWAKLRGRERVYGHSNGVGSVRACVEAAIECGVRYLSLFAFSQENWGRPADEVDTLMNMIFKAIDQELGTLIKQGVRLRVLGDFSRLDPALAEAVRLAEASSIPPAGEEPVLDLVIFLSYSGKWDILQAAKSLARDYMSDPSGLEKAGPQELASRLVTAGIPDPDLIIRTSGESRISNYLLWQAAYSEFLFVDTLWPDFRKDEFRSALEEFSKRDRRYGKVK
ncbi:MAG: di-trans,poly-cis-decaprenylcistransferase [Bacteroidales bacterium]|nr:di-trans,poly-cis-decaprenylcistransferase [Bacteroidales bacterium]